VFQDKVERVLPAQESQAVAGSKGVGQKREHSLSRAKGGEAVQWNPN